MKKLFLILLVILLVAGLAKPVLAPALVPYEVIYPYPTPEGVILEKNVYVTMRDGIKIALDIYKPAKGKGPWPVIFAYSPFAKERFFESAKPAFYCLNGYVCVQAAERGSGFNQGQFTFHGAAVPLDGYDIVEWIAQQPWCNSNVGMMGASGYGVDQWKTAVENPPHLKCLAVLGATDNYRGTFQPGGVQRRPFILMLISGIQIAAIWPGTIPGKEPPMDVIGGMFANWQDGPFWWEHGSTWKQIDQIKAPVLNIMRTPDMLHATSQLRSYADIKSPKKLIITPWTSDLYQPWIFETTSFNQHVLRWFDYWLKGIDTGIMNEPEVAIYDNGTGKWRYENEYPLARTQWTKFYLHEKTAITEPWGSISKIPPAKDENPDTYLNPSARGKPQFVAYTTPPLEEDLVVKGPASFTLYAKTTEEITTDWSFFIKMGEMVPRGEPLNPVTGKPEIKPGADDPWTPREVQIWSWGPFKAKFRELDESMSRPGIPWHSFQNPANLKPNTVYEFQVELQPIFKTFKAGNRIWVQIAGEDADYATLDVSSPYVEPPAPLKFEISVYHDSKHQSHLLLPIIPDAPEIKPVAPPLCDALPGAPRFTE